MKDAEEVAKWLVELIDDHGAAATIVAIPTQRPQSIVIYDVSGRKLYILMVANAHVQPGQPE